MISPEISKEVLDLPEADRLDLARRLIESVETERGITTSIAEGVRRIEEVVTGRVEGLTEAQFRQALQ